MIVMKKVSLSISVSLCLILLLFSFNVTAGKIPKKKLKLVRTITEIDGLDDPVFQPQSVDTDFEGNLYILDRANHRIIKTDSQGKLITTWGRKGYGPRELNISLSDSLHINTNSDVYVESGSLIKVFDKSGNYIKQINIGKLFYNFAISSQGFLYCTNSLKSVEDTIIHIYDNNGKQIRSFGSNIIHHSFFKFGIQNPYFRMMTRSSLFINNGDQVTIAFNTLPIIIRYDANGKLLWKKSIPIEKIGIYPEKAVKHVSKFYDPESMKISNKDDIALFYFIVNIKEDKNKIMLLANVFYPILIFDDNGDLSEIYLMDDSVLASLKEAQGNINFCVNKKTGNIYIYSNNDWAIYELSLN